MQILSALGLYLALLFRFWGFPEQCQYV